MGRADGTPALFDDERYRLLTDNDLACITREIREHAEAIRVAVVALRRAPWAELDRVQGCPPSPSIKDPEEVDAFFLRRRASRGPRGAQVLEEGALARAVPQGAGPEGERPGQCVGPTNDGPDRGAQPMQDIGRPGQLYSQRAPTSEECAPIARAAERAGKPNFRRDSGPRSRGAGG